MTANVREFYDAKLAAEPLRMCLECGELYQPKALHQLFCCERHRYRCRDASTPETVLKARARFAAWHERTRGPVMKRQPLLFGEPPHHEHLPGGGFMVTVAPLRWPISLRNARLLHGLMTQLTGLPHDPHVPVITLVPPVADGGKWGAWIADFKTAMRLSDKSWPARFAGQDVTVECGPFMRPLAPKVKRRGRHRVRLACLSPVRVRQGASEYTAPTAENLISTIGSWLPRRLGVVLPDDAVQLTILDDHSRPEAVSMGGKYGDVYGFMGALDLDVNAPTRWLLESAARGIGLGGMTAFGFGRVKVTGL